MFNCENMRKMLSTGKSSFFPSSSVLSFARSFVGGVRTEQDVDDKDVFGKSSNSIVYQILICSGPFHLYNS